MTDNILERLTPFIHDEVRMPAGLIKDVIDEIERLRAELDDCNNDFDCLSQMHNKIRTDLDKWKRISEDLYDWTTTVLGVYMTTPAVRAYEKAVRGD